LRWIKLFWSFLTSAASNFKLIYNNEQQGNLLYIVVTGHNVEITIFKIDTLTLAT
jgi:hypothetical protein